ncbi:S9 family peptidase [Flavivirga spongiicola]|uniref:Prolyl oligopeptidase family serine peptidase n=1 Tax=Flavivirga spongiicola TaxID=421621 RepID=A0ABU7XP07_9FLAO|nr:prolyl oligopeptidase family serine peptidase [Flavivirga sp. MEBiC05379]MDO5977494.1 prolyl oligopeptidase family serine peptidase [Flavivirga sp. MEBiC05379]
MKHFYYLVYVLSMVTATLQSQNLSQEDYKRAVSYMYNNYNNKTVFNLDTPVDWFKDGSGIWFIEYSKKGKTYKTVHFKKDQEATLLFDHEKLAKAFLETFKEEIKPTDLSLSKIEYENEKKLSFNTLGKSYVLNLESYKLELKEEKKAENNPLESKSPNGKWVAYSKDYNLYIKSTETNNVHQLSFDGKKNYEYASYYGWYDIMEGENGERPKRFTVSWSPDSKWLATKVIDLSNAEKMYLLDWSKDSLYKPKLLSYYRGSPGDTTMVYEKPVFYNIDTKKEVKTSLPKGTHINSISTNWSDKSGVLFANYLERGFQKEYVKQIDLNTNTERTLITETSNTNIDNFRYFNLEEKGKIIFLSERSGWRQLYSLDLKTYKITALTKGDYYINDVNHIDKSSGDVYFLASGKETSNNPYHQQVYKVTLKGKTTLLTPENKHHAVSFSKDGKYFVDNYSTVHIPTKTILRASKTGKILTELTQADVSEVVSKGWKSPEVFSLLAKDEKTTIYGVIWKPTNFDASKSYPIIDATYTGPHTQVFSKSFDRAFRNQSLAELGFIVMNVDGLGTSGRSKAFHNHSYKNMGNNLEDHILAIKYLGKKYSWINTDKVGIFGHSAGGFDTGRAMVVFPDFYKVGVASSGDHDFRMEKAWWPEMYQGWPVDESYQEVSNITNAKNLKGKLLLVHGGLDDNVNPSATFKFAEALINADKEFDLLILPSQRHGYVGKHRNYFIKKRWNYFVEHLLGVKPIWNFSLGQ